MVALATFLWVQEPYEMGITGLKTSESKSEGFGSSGTLGRVTSGIFPKTSTLLAFFLPSLSCIRDLEGKEDHVWVKTERHLSKQARKCW